MVACKSLCLDAWLKVMGSWMCFMLVKNEKWDCKNLRACGISKLCATLARGLEDENWILMTKSDNHANDLLTLVLALVDTAGIWSRIMDGYVFVFGVLIFGTTGEPQDYDLFMFGWEEEIPRCSLSDEEIWRGVSNE